MSQTDSVSQLVDAIASDDDSAQIAITELPTRIKVGIRAEPDSDYYAVINGSKAEQAETFLSTYTDAIRQLYRLHAEHAHDTPEWCYDVGEVIHGLYTEQGHTQKEVKKMLKPLADHPEISFSKWKMFHTQNVYDFYPDKESLPNVDVGSGSKFGLLCGHADTPEELHDVFDRLPPAEISNHIEGNGWNHFKDSDEYDLHDVAAKVNQYARQRDGTDRRVDGVRRLYRMLDANPPDADAARDAVQATAE